MSTLCIFEDQGYTNLLPLVYLRPVYELRCGIEAIMNKIRRFYRDTETVLFCRDYLGETLKENTEYPVNEVTTDRGCLFINGRVLMSGHISPDGEEEIGITHNTVVYARLNKAHAGQVTPSLCLDQDFLLRLKSMKVKFTRLDVPLINYPWDLISNNASQIEEDIKAAAQPCSIEGRVYDGASLLNEPRIHLGKGSRIKPGAVLDAENGPVYIDEDVTVYPNSSIEGPVFIGRGTKIKTGAKIYEGTSIGEVCKVGGEVEESIIHSYSNKQHHGFLGHAYLGSWCNIGAGTSSSDLKNNYGNVKVQLGDKVIDTGLMFVGLIMGDYSKSGINTMFNTGTVAGIMTNIFGEGFPPKFIPSFTWGGSHGMVTYNLEKALEMTERVMRRRGKELTPAQVQLISAIFKLTEGERSFL